MADAIVSIALEKLSDIALGKIGEEISSIKGVKTEVLSISSELTRIRTVLEDAENRRYKEPSIQDWLNKLEDLSSDVEDVLDEWYFASLHREIEGFEDAVPPMKKVRSLFTIPYSFYKKVTTHRDMAAKIKGLKDRLDKIVEEKDRYRFALVQVADPRVSERVISTSLIDVKEIQGRQGDKDVLVNKLILGGADQESGPDVVSIVGPGGIGKTTVAQLVYNDDRVKNCFNSRIWIFVSDVFDEVRIAKEIVEIVEKSSPNVTGLEALLNRVTHSISGKRFLLVLDDVWTEDYRKWEPIKNSLKCGGPGSKILVTTRSERVARMMGTIEIHRLGLLSDTDCWQLMQKMAFSWRREEKCGRLQDIGKNIAKKCKGLPLAAKVLGKLLRSKDAVEAWENVLNSEIWRLKEAEDDLVPHYLLSYNELSPAMKCCFSHCSIFPKDSEINVKKLIRMWLAIGYLGSGGSPNEWELTGKEYFDNLRMRSLLQERRFAKSGDEMCCEMHDIVHGFAQFLIKNRIPNLEDPSLISQIKANRSLYCCKELPLEDLLDVVTCLRVLSLRACQLEVIPVHVANLIHLRYLDLSGSSLTPQALQTICKLYYLQTLYLRGCKLKEIPRKIGSLIQLRELDLSCNPLTPQALQTISKLCNLQTLYLSGCDLEEIPWEIGKLTQLRELDLSSNPLAPQALQTICKLDNLQTLYLRDCGLEIPMELGNLIQLRHLSLSGNTLILQILQTICKLYNLQTLYLRRCGLEEIPREIGQLIQLRELDLSSNPLAPQALQTICKLYNLQTLYLRDCGLEIPMELGNLIQLIHLNLSGNTLILQALQTICKLYNLQTLYLSGCGLEEIPREIGQLIQLRELDLSSNPLAPQALQTIGSYITCKL